MSIYLIEKEEDYQFLINHKNWQFWHQYTFPNKLIYGEIGRIKNNIFVMYSNAKDSKEDYEESWKKNNILVKKYVQIDG